MRFRTRILLAALLAGALSPSPASAQQPVDSSAVSEEAVRILSD